MDLRYKLKTAPVIYPVQLAEVKDNLHILHSDLDTLLQNIIYAAIDDAQSFTGRQFARATYTAYLDAYPDNDEIEITLGPVNAITSIKYYAQDAAELITVNAPNYQLDNIDLTARLRILESFSPDSDRMNVIEIEFTNGWATPLEIPANIRDAIILLASERYLHPENQILNFSTSLRMNSAMRLLEKYKVQRF